jgi:hypothetical protein
VELEKRLGGLECERLELEQRVNECEGRNRGLCATNEERGAEAIPGVVYSNEKVDCVAPPLAPLAFDAAGWRPWRLMPRVGALGV